VEVVAGREPDPQPASTTVATAAAVSLEEQLAKRIARRPR
jgi:hypothetical protein